jgi:hypothetical protein
VVIGGLRAVGGNGGGRVGPEWGWVALRGFLSWNGNMHMHMVKDWDFRKVVMVCASSGV